MKEVLPFKNDKIKSYKVSHINKAMNIRYPTTFKDIFKVSRFNFVFDLEYVFSGDLSMVST